MFENEERSGFCSAEQEEESNPISDMLYCLILRYDDVMAYCYKGTEGTI